MRHLIPIIDEWVFCVSKKGVRELIIDMGYDDFCWRQVLHSSIYSCKNLTKLELFDCDLDPPPPTFNGFLFLKCLSLNGAVLSGNGINSLVSVCPLLERFRLVDFAESELSISAPNLKWLRLSGYCRKISLYTPLLAEISVGMSYLTAEHQQQKTSVCNFVNLLGGITDLEKLSGYCDFPKYLSDGIESCHHSLVFHRLKFIELHEVSFQDEKQILVVTRLLNDAPNLRELTIRSDSYNREHNESESEALDLRFRDFGCAPSFKLEKLRVFTMFDIICLPVEVEFLKFMLGISPVLETMRVDTTPTPEEIGTEEKQNLRAELVGCNWASPFLKLWMTHSDVSPAVSVLLSQSEEGSTK